MNMEKMYETVGGVFKKMVGDKVSGEVAEKIVKDTVDCVLNAMDADVKKAVEQEKAKENLMDAIDNMPAVEQNEINNLDEKEMIKGIADDISEINDKGTLEEQMMRHYSKKLDEERAKNKRMMKKVIVTGAVVGVITTAGIFAYRVVDKKCKREVEKYVSTMIRKIRRKFR